MTDSDKSASPSENTSDAPADDASDPTKHIPFVLLPSRPDADPYHVHTTTRLDWTPGHPCPVCGSTRIASTYVGSELYHHSDGSMLRLATGDKFGPVEYECVSCDTLLRRHVAFDLFLAMATPE